MFGGKHVPSHRFNAGEKIVFWVGGVVLGLAVVVSGLVLDGLVPGFGETRGGMQVSHIVHAVASVLMMALFTLGLQTLGLAEAYTLTFVAPLLITMLAVPVLKEAALPRHWVVIAVGLCGVVVALRADPQGIFSVGALATLCAALQKSPRRRARGVSPRW